jgi:hypothetical protein
MKAYGIPRILDVEYPDVVDIQRYAMKSSAGKMKGDEHSYTRNVEAKRTTRRHFKRIERMKAKAFIRGELS